MRTDEFIHLITKQSTTEEQRLAFCDKIPLGYDSIENMTFAFSSDAPSLCRHVCVTGVRKTSFLKRLLITLMGLYKKTESQFFVLSPKTEYGELLRLKGVDVTIPYVRNKSDLDSAMQCIKALMEMRAQRQKREKFFLVLDGIEDLSGCNANGDLEEYRNFFDVVSRKKDVVFISGVELIKSIFSGYPGAYVGVGNCLITTREEGKADVTYVGEDASLTMPKPISYPCTPSITETVIALNAENRNE